MTHLNGYEQIHAKIVKRPLRKRAENGKITQQYIFSFSSMAGQDSLNQMLRAPPLRACVERNNPSGERERVIQWRLSAPVN